jgi:tetrapyrrole methylase family protein/MazG family protein/ATP diphosphatase
LAGLVELMDRLRGPDGCPWDREQSYASLRPYLLEECFEVAEAIDLGEPALLCEELGDLLFQIVFLSRLAKEDGRFTIEDVTSGISEKLIRRHPHVFGEATAETADEVARNWEEIKREEKGAERPFLASVPRSLPALLGAQRLGDKAAQVGFDWPEPGAVLDKVEEETRELRAALASADPPAIREELGDLLFSIVMLARKIGVDADAALAGTNRKFRSRFTRVEQEVKRRGGRLADVGTETLEELWNESKHG